MAIARVSVLEANDDARIAASREALGENDFDAAWAEGAALSTAGSDRVCTAATARREYRLARDEHSVAAQDVWAGMIRSSGIRAASASDQHDSRRVMAGGLLPLLWWCLTLLTGALGVWYEIAGDVVVMWNFLGAAGLILTLPAAILSAVGSRKLRSADTWKMGRGYATAGLGLATTFCLWMVANSVLEIVAPSPRDPYSWTPSLSNGEQIVLAIPYAIMLLVVLTVLVGLWRRNYGASRRSNERRVTQSRQTLAHWGCRRDA